MKKATKSKTTRKVNQKKMEVGKIILSFVEHKLKNTNQVTNFQIADYVYKTMNVKISDADIRKTISDFRNQNIVSLLLANSKGYFVAQNELEVKEWMSLHRKKIDSMKITLQNIERQLERRLLVAEYYGEKF